MRDLIEVNTAILCAIPDPVLREKLRKATKGVLTSYYYAAPEAMPRLWQEYALRMEAELGHDEAARPWLKEVRAIFREAGLERDVAELKRALFEQRRAIDELERRHHA
jgi:hypothetical protein